MNLPSEMTGKAYIRLQSRLYLYVHLKSVFSVYARAVDSSSKMTPSLGEKIEGKVRGVRVRDLQVP